MKAICVFVFIYPYWHTNEKDKWGYIYWCGQSSQAPSLEEDDEPHYKVAKEIVFMYVSLPYLFEFIAFCDYLCNRQSN